MGKQVLDIRKLEWGDLGNLKKMDTGIEDDYVIRIFPKLIESEEHDIYGLFQGEALLSVAGYTIFADKFAMLGRMRSDRRYIGHGYSTEVMSFIAELLSKKPNIHWIGANTQTHNYPAQRVIERSGMKPGPVHYYAILKTKTHHPGKSGPPWKKIEELDQKRTLLSSLNDNALGAFPYECYYPLPFDKVLFTDEYLNECTFYINPEEDRFVIFRNDQKGDLHTHVKYFWDDHFEQPGFFETVYQNWNENPEAAGAWIDFSETGFKNIPDLSIFEVQKPWRLYSRWF